MREAPPHRQLRRRLCTVIGGYSRRTNGVTAAGERGGDAANAEGRDWGAVAAMTVGANGKRSPRTASGGGAPGRRSVVLGPVLLWGA